jgi:hypothetical protein
MSVLPIVSFDIYPTMDTFKALFLTFFACVLASVSMLHPVESVAQECNFEQNLTISLNRNTAVVKNNSDSCSFTFTLAAYDMPYAQDSHPEWISAQELLGYVSETLNPGDEKTLTVSDSNSKYCRVQTDLFRGTVVLEPPYYVNNLAAEIYALDCPSPTATPTPSASPMPTASPVATVAPTTTPTPTIPPAPGGDGLSDGLGCSVQDCSGNQIGGQVLGASTSEPSTQGRVLPFTGVDANPWIVLIVCLSAFVAGFGFIAKAHRISEDIRA